MLGEIRLAPAILFYLLYVVRHPDLRQRSGDRDLAIDAAVWRAVRVVLLRDVRTDLAVAARSTGPGRWCVVDVCWGTFVTAVSSTLGLVIANWLAPKI